MWFVLDGEDVVFTTGASSVKGQAFRRDPYTCLCVDDQMPPFGFVMVEGPVESSTDLDELRRVATRIGRRYMGAGRADEFGARNATEGELLVRVRPMHVLAEADLADEARPGRTRVPRDGRRASDAERDATMDRLREAAAEGRLTLEELTDRIEAAASAVMRSDLAPLTSDLPATAAVGGATQTADVRGVGDVKRSGTWTVPAENSFRTWFGNIKLDLREAQISAPETHIHARGLFGNIDLLVPEGVEVEVQARTQVGGTKLQAGSGIPGAPRIVLTGGTFFGDIKVATGGCGRSSRAGAD